MKKNCEKVKYIAIMISESFAWAGYGNTETEAKEMIQENYSKIMGESSMEYLEDEYGFRIMECGRDECMIITL